MNLKKWIVAGLVLGFGAVGVADMNGVGFFAPAVDGKENVYDPETGAIVYDKDDQKFYGHDHLGNWVGLTAQGQFLENISTGKTPGVSGDWLQMTDNSVVLTDGTWRVSGTVQSAGNAGVTYLLGRWSDVNGTDSSTDPTIFPDIEAGSDLAQNYFSGANGTMTTQMPTVRITVTGTDTLYLVPRWQGSTPASATVTTFIYAEKIN